MLNIYWISWLLSGLLFIQNEPSAYFNNNFIEICDNGIDDDGDGLIDLNDDECECETEQISSLIPNLSFEDMSCCPDFFGQLNCADNWIQASNPTTDYLHTCDFLGLYPVPLPIPDGEGCVGFRNGRPPGQPNFKEYTGACLNGFMPAGTEYTLEFYLGFYNSIQSPPINITLFGTSDCSNLPFGGTDPNFGCPTNGPGWIEITQTGVVSASSGWIQISMTFTPTQDIYAIALGPDCAPVNLTDNFYYYFDDLLLAETVSFNTGLEVFSGSSCTDDLVIGQVNIDTLSYQWYKDGVALVGETNSTLQVPPAPGGYGNYQLIVSSQGACAVSGEFLVEDLSEQTNLFEDICDGEVYYVGSDSFNASGIYTAVLQTSEGCDSTVNLVLSVLPVADTVFQTNLCEGESFMVGDSIFSEAGDYSMTIPAINGCDSSIQFSISLFPLSDTFLFENICSGESFELNGIIYDETGVYEQVFTSVLGCDSTLVLDLIVNNTYDSILNVEICDGASFAFGFDNYNQSGTYDFATQTIAGCDSLMTLNLTVHPIADTLLEYVICAGDSVRVGDFYYTISGNYLDTFVHPETNCDSLVYLDLTVLEPATYLSLPDTVSVELGNSVSVTPQTQPEFISDFYWTDLQGQQVDSSLVLDLFPVNSNYYIFKLTDINGCEQEDTTFIEVKKNYDIFVPNVFTPNGDGNNDKVSVYGSIGVEKVLIFKIFDRWGGQVYESANFPVNDLAFGWNGIYKGKELNPAVFVFYAEVLFYDGIIKKKMGSIALVK